MLQIEKLKDCNIFIVVDGFNGYCYGFFNSRNDAMLKTMKPLKPYKHQIYI